MAEQDRQIRTPLPISGVNPQGEYSGDDLHASSEGAAPQLSVVGAGVGAVGAEVGDTLGNGVGAALGETLGNSVGRALGDTDGAAVGEIVGLCVHNAGPHSLDCSFHEQQSSTLH